MLSEYLKTLKNQRNLTNAQIASMSGVSESTVSRLLKGESKSVDYATVLDIVRALGGSMDAASGGATASHNSISDAQLAAMQDKILEVYTEEIRKDIIETYNMRVAEVYRVNDQRVANEKAHYDQLIADKDAMHQQRIDNLMSILDARNKTINRLFLICGAMAICLIALLILNIFFPTNPILKW